MNSYERIFSNKISSSYKYLPNSSLLSLLELTHKLFIDDSHQEALELGCGTGLTFDFFDSHLNSTGLDFSLSAINFAEEDSSSNFICEDILRFKSDKLWDWVFDSHLLHCLIGETQILQYLNTVFNLLRSGGVFSLELMVQTKDAYFDEGYIFNESDSCLYKDKTPVRTILGARAVEDLILSIGFKIVYLRVDENIKFIPIPGRSESFLHDPDRMRIICLKE